MSPRWDFYAHIDCFRASDDPLGLAKHLAVGLFCPVMKALHESVYEVRIPVVRQDSSAKLARERIKQIPRDRRVACVAVSRKNRHQILKVLKVILAEDTTKLEQLEVEGWICKLSNGEPTCDPLWGPGARRWLTWFLSKQGADYLFLGTDSTGYVRLALVDRNLYVALTTPHADCYCPRCEQPYSIDELPDHALCRVDRNPIKCI